MMGKDLETIAAGIYGTPAPRPIAPDRVAAATALTGALDAPASVPAVQKPPSNVEQVDPPTAASAVPTQMNAAADVIYGGTAPTTGWVDWSEPPAQPADYELHAPTGIVDMSPEGKAAMEALREGFAAAGAGMTLASELFADAVRAQQGGFQVSARSAEADLRAQYGPAYETKIAAAKGLIRQVAQRCPSVVGFLEQTGLGNDPAFIRKVVAAAARRRR